MCSQEKVSTSKKRHPPKKLDTLWHFFRTKGVSCRVCMKLLIRQSSPKKTGKLEVSWEKNRSRGTESYQAGIYKAVPLLALQVPKWPAASGKWKISRFLPDGLMEKTCDFFFPGVSTNGSLGGNTNAKRGKRLIHWTWLKCVITNLGIHETLKNRGKKSQLSKNRENRLSFFCSGIFAWFW